MKIDILSHTHPLAGGVIEGIDAFADEVRVLGGEFCGIEACDDAEER